jgi:hypothetical protein
MSEAFISAVAALTGSALGGLTPIISNYLVQRGLTQRELLTRDLVERQNLYAEFIQFGTTLYVSATTKEPRDENFDDLVNLICSRRSHSALRLRSRNRSRAGFCRTGRRKVRTCGDFH